MLSGECNYREKQFFHKRHIKVINWGKGSGNVKGGWGQWTALLQRVGDQVNLAKGI